MNVTPIVLDGDHVRLQPLAAHDADALVAAASDGELWNSTVTIVPTHATMSSYITSALIARDSGTELPFTIVRKSSGRIVGSTRFYGIDRNHRRIEIGHTWLSASAQRSNVNTEAKLLLLTHAFEVLGCIRVGFVTDVLNQQSRTAIARLGARQEGILRNHMIMPDGRFRDSVYFSILQTEWPEVKVGLRDKLDQWSPRNVWSREK